MNTYYLDLFAGIGGFVLGAYWAGLRFTLHFYSEVDDYAIKVYKRRFPDAVGLGDITKIDGTKLPKGEWIISGGFPCQDISVAGKGAGLAGSRSGLWYEYARIISELRPRYAIMENVGALSFRGLDTVLGSLAKIGYDAEWQDIRASDVGAPHRRERLWIIAYPHDNGFNGSKDTKSTAQRGDTNKTMENELVESSRSGYLWETDVVNPNSERREEQSYGFATRARNADGQPCGEDFSYTDSGRCEQCNQEKRSVSEFNEICAAMADATDGWNVRGDGELESAQGQMREHRGSQVNGRREWWKVEPDVRCMADGLPASLGRYEGRTCVQSFERVNQLKCLGNSIVPQIAELIFAQEAFDDFRSRRFEKPE